MADTVFKIRLDYDANTAKAKSGVDSLGFKMISLNQTLDLFRKGWDLVGKAIRPMIDVNKELEMSRIRIAGIANATEGWTGGISRGLKEATVLMKGFTADAAASVATTRDFVNIGAKLAPVLLPAGKGMSDLRDVTKAVVDGASSLGIELSIAGDQLSRMIMGQAGMDLVTFTTLFAGEMNKFGKGFTASFNEMTQSKRLELILEKLDKFKAAGAEIENSFTGVTSTLEDLFELTMADVGKPLFEAITKEIKEWLKWIDANRRSVEQFVAGAGQALLDTFRFLRDAIKYIVDHREELMAIAIAWGAVKLGGGLAGMAKGGVGGAMGKALGAFGGKSSIPVSIIGITGAAAGMWAAAMLGEQRKTIERTELGFGVANVMKSFRESKIGGAQAAVSLGELGLDRAMIERLASDKGLRETFRTAVESGGTGFEAAAAMKDLPPIMHEIAMEMRTGGDSANLFLNNLRTLRRELESDELAVAIMRPVELFYETMGAEMVRRLLEPLERERKRRAKKGPKLKISVTIIQDFKANANPDRIKVATIKALEKVGRSAIMPRTAPPVG